MLQDELKLEEEFIQFIESRDCFSRKSSKDHGNKQKQELAFYMWSVDHERDGTLEI